MTQHRFVPERGHGPPRPIPHYRPWFILVVWLLLYVVVGCLTVYLVVRYLIPALYPELFGLPG